MSQVSGVKTVLLPVSRIIMDSCVNRNVTALRTSIVIMSEDVCVTIPVAIVQRKVRSTNSHLYKETDIILTWLTLFTLFIVSDKTTLEVHVLTGSSFTPCKYNACCIKLSPIRLLKYCYTLITTDLKNNFLYRNWIN